MNYDPRRHGEFAELSALRLSAQRSIALVMRRSIYLSLLVAGTVGAVGASLCDSDWQPRAIMAASMLAAGGLVGIILAHYLSRTIGRITVRPIELLLAQPGMLQDIDAGTLHWQQGRALGRAEIESDMAALNRHLRRVARRSREVMMELEGARERANQQQITQSQFLAKMSHELRTPLNAILGYAMLLQEDATDAGNASAVADLDRIQLAGRNLLAVINDILDLARIEAGKTVVERGLINVRELVDAAVAACPPDQRNGNHFELVVSEAVAIMVCDAGKVRQCLLNLLSNAFKFTSNGTVTLTIAPTTCGGLPGIAFSVRDTGIGISPDHLEGLFDAFSQIDEGPSRRFGGPGLGLAITRRLARMMGGDCTVESVAGEGSVFSLTLPLNLRAKAQGDEPRVLSGNGHPLPVRTSDRSVLIIEDDEAAIDLMLRWLEGTGYDVFAAPDGESGLAMACEHKPDLILLDALLPGISGYDVLAELRADPALSRTPVVLITVDDDRVRGLAAGASDYLRKPITEEQLRSVVDLYRGKASGDILVIDDDDDAAELIKRSVEQIGFSTRRASDGLQGVAMATDFPPTAIVLDLSMPHLDGFGVIQRLSADEKLSEIPVIIVSGYDVSLSEHRALAAAGYRFFTKGSATPREIAQSLREMVA